MGLFGGKDDTKSKIEELKAKMQQGQPQQGWQQPPQQPWQPPQPQYQPPQQTWQPPREEREQRAPEPVRAPEPSFESYSGADMEGGIILDLGDGMSLNLPVQQRMKLDEFLRIADRVRELKKIEHPQRY